MRSKINNIVKNKYIVSFAFSVLAMSLMLSYSQLLMNGKYCIMLGDNSSIYIPVILQFIRNIREGHNIYYSWTNSFGMDTSLINAFSAYNPFNFIYLLLPNLNPEIFTAFCIIVKTGLASLGFQLFVKKALKIDNYYTVLFSVMYSMCAFQIDSNVINIIWLDAMFMLPIIFWGVHELVENGKFIVLTISLSYLFITNFYMGYIVGIATIIYFILLMFFAEVKYKSNFNIIFKFFVSGFIAVLISSFSWIPAALFMLNNYAADSTTETYLMANILDVISQMFIGKDTGTKGLMPDIYCGILTLLILPFFFSCKSIRVKTKLLYGIIFAFYLLCIFIKPIYMFVHVFDSPDGWYFRFAFIISFLMCAMSVQAYKYVDEINSKVLIVYSIVLFAINVVSSALQPIRFEYSTLKPLLPFLAINLIALIIWVSVIIFHKKYNSNYAKNYSALITFLVIAEVILNGFFAYNGVLDLKKDSFNAWNLSQNETMKILSQDEDLYRVSYYNNLFVNGDTWYGYNGLTDFNTAENPNIRYLLTKLGVYTTTRVVQNFGTNEFLDLILGVKYTVMGIHPNTFDYSQYKPKIINNDYIGIGFVVSDDILEYKSGNNAFENNNLLASLMIGDDIDIFDDIDKKDVKVENDGIELLETGDGRYYLDDVSDGEGGVITFLLDSNQYNSDTYMYIDNEESIVFKRSYLFLDGQENSIEVKGFTSVSYLKKFENDSDSKYVSIYSNDLKQQVMNNYYFASINNESVDYIYKTLLQQKLNISSFDNGYIIGEINTINDDSMMFTSIPYSNGWKVIVDGKETEIIPLLENSFIGIKIKGTGNHVIEMRYIPKGVKVSVILTLTGILLLIIACIIDLKTRKNL